MSAPLTLALGARAPSGDATEPDRASSLIIESDFALASEIESLTLRDTRPIAEQQADWDALRAMIASWTPQPIELDEAA